MAAAAAAAAAALVDMRIHPCFVGGVYHTVCGGTIAANIVDEDEGVDGMGCGLRDGAWWWWWMLVGGRRTDGRPCLQFQISAIIQRAEGQTRAHVVLSLA